MQLASLFGLLFLALHANAGDAQLMEMNRIGREHRSMIDPLPGAVEAAQPAVILHRATCRRLLTLNEKEKEGFYAWGAFLLAAGGGCIGFAATHWHVPPAGALLGFGIAFVIVGAFLCFYARCANRRV